MAFKLNLRDVYIDSPPLRTSTPNILGARARLRWIDHFGYLASPKMHMMSAALTFLLGLTLATLRPMHLAPGTGYDMTPTGSIVGSTSHPSKARSCD